jgi:hypothetical protein
MTGAHFFSQSHNSEIPGIFINSTGGLPSTYQTNPSSVQSVSKTIA